jgi:molybdate-binding protein
LREPDLVLIAWAVRQQGLLLHSRHAAIATLAEAVRAGLRLGRRQPGAGAQVLALQLLREAGAAEESCWSEHVYRTHDDLAAAILQGAVDAGVGIETVARRSGLTFRPLLAERFDLALRRRDYFEPPFQRLLAFTRGPRFQEQADALGGYDVTNCGEVRFNA